MGKYDVIIIGSGLGGLECGVLLCKEGYNVCIVEKNPVFGGCLRPFRRYGCNLDTGVHYFGGMEEGGILNQCFRYMGIRDRLRLRALDREHFDMVRCDGRTYGFACGHESFADSLSEYFPAEREGLKRYAGMLGKVGACISLDNFRKGYMSGPEGLSYMQMPASGTIDTLIHDPLLRRVLSCTAMLYGGEKDRSSFYEHGMIMSSLLEGAYRCEDDSGQIADALISEIKRNGGTLVGGFEVSGITVRHGMAAGVVASSGERIEAGNVISDVHPALTLKMLEGAPVRPSYRHRIESLDNTCGMFTMYLLMKPGTCPYLNHNMFVVSGQDAWIDRNVRSGMKSCLVSMQPSSEDPDHARTVSVMTPMFIDELSEWSDTHAGNRGEGYAEFKRGKENELEAMVRDSGFRMEGTVENRLSTTPLSYRDFTGTRDGSAYGILKDWHDPLRTLVQPATKIPNLYLTGQNINVHGVLGVTMSSVLTCTELTHGNRILQKIAYV